MKFLSISMSPKLYMLIKNMYTLAKFHASQYKAVVKPLCLETNHAHLNVGDSTYSYSFLRIVQKLGSKNKFKLFWKIG